MYQRLLRCCVKATLYNYLMCDRDRERERVHLEAGTILYKNKHLKQIYHIPPTTLAKCDQLDKRLFSLPLSYLTSYLIYRYIYLLLKITASLVAVSSVNSVGRKPCFDWTRSFEHKGVSFYNSNRGAGGN